MNIDTLADTLYENFNNGYSDDTQVEEASEDARSFGLFTDFDSGSDGIIHAILTEYADGTYMVDQYPSKQAAEIAWDGILRELDEYLTDPLDFDEDNN